MQDCIFENNRARCSHFESCAEGTGVTLISLGQDETTTVCGPGLCMAFAGETRSVPGSIGAVIAPFDAEIIPLPDGSVTVGGSIAGSVYMFGFDVLAMFLRECLGPDPVPSRRTPYVYTPLMSRYRMAAFCDGMAPDQFGCRKYMAMKMRELAFLMHGIYGPGKVAKLLRPTVTRDVVFRMRATELFRRGRTPEGTARELGLSLSGFNKRFRRVMGVPPYKWNLDRRINLLCHELRYTDIPLHELSARHGFCSVQHLGRTFLAKTGHTPAAYRRSFRG